MSKYSIRPHHMLCLQFFEGKGYSDRFVNNMMQIKKHLDVENPVVHIIESADDICADCPNNIAGQCKSEEEILQHDQRVYRQVADIVGTQATWKDITKAIKTNIIYAGKMKQVCGTCQWSEICFHKRG